MKIAIINGAKALAVPFENEEYLFLFNGAAMFEIDEQGGTDKMFERFGQKGKAGVEAIGEVCAILSRQADAALQYAGLSPRPIFKTELLLTPITTPEKILFARIMAVEAINLGHGREVKEDDEEIDLVLAELEKKIQRKG